MGNDCCTKGPQAYATDHLDKRSSWRQRKEAELGEALSKVPVITVNWTPAHALYLQNCIRVYLTLKRTRQIEPDWLNFSEDEACPAQATSEANIDPVTLLSQKAQETLAKLEPFAFDQPVRGVQPHPPMYLLNGGIYIGQWSSKSNGTVPKGKGKLYTSEGGYKEGYWKNGQLHRKGRIVYPNGDWYTGDIRSGNRSGTGTFTSHNGLQTYVGHWKRDMKSGKGEEKLSNESTYTGRYKRDKRSGKGVMRWKDGSHYEGDFKDDQVTGTGVFTWQNGRVYSGTVLNGKMHGKGKFRFPDGSEYDGEYEHDKKSGQGRYVWAGGEYQGQWKDGKMHGVGWLKLTGKERIKAQFEAGKKVKDLTDK